MSDGGGWVREKKDERTWRIREREEEKEQERRVR